MRAHLRHIRSSGWLFAVCWMTAIAAIAFWVTRTSNGTLRYQLRHSQFWILEGQFLGVVILSWITMPDLLRSLRLTRADLRWPLGASVLAFSLATLVAPQTSRIYYDEQIYQSVGQNMSDLHLAQMCNDGTVEYGALQCWSGEYNKEPYGYPYLLSVAYRVTGVHEPVAFVLNTVVAAASVWIVFLITTALTSSAAAGGYAALVMALIPEQLRWSHTAAAEPSAALACAFAVLTALAFTRLRTTRALLWMVVSSIFAVQFRPECVLVAPLVAAVCLAYAPEEFRQRRLWWACLIGLVLSAVHVGHLLAVRHEGWGSTGTRFSMAFLVPNLRVNGWFYFGDPRFPFVYSLLGLTACVLWRSRALVVCLVYFLLFWGIFLVFYAGSYNYGADVRFSLMTYPPLTILAGIGAWRLVEQLDALRSQQQRGLIVAALLVVPFLWYVPFVRGVGEEAWAARADVAFARTAARELLPPNSIVLTHNPNMFHVWGRNAAQLSLAIRDGSYAPRVLAPRFTGGVYFHWNFWCNVADPLQQSFCTTALSQFPHTLVRESRERDYRYAIYRLDLAAETATPAKP